MINLDSYQPIRTSVVSHTSRANQWGSNRYGGNCDGRIFADLVIRYGAKSVADPMMGSGTTRDCIADLNNQGADITYWGGDLNHGFNLCDNDIPGEFDFVWIHPPYWNLIRYSHRPGDLSSLTTYDEFHEQLKICLRKCHKALRSGGRLAVLMGDVHYSGKYYPICRDIMNMQPDIGELRTILVNQMNNCWSDIIPMKRTKLPVDGITIRHELCMIFKKSA